MASFPSRAKLTTILSWSFSRYSTYSQCPLKLKLSALDKIQEPKNDAMTRGALIHDEARDYLMGKVRTVPKSLKLVGDELKRLRRVAKLEVSQASIEDNWAFKNDWTLTRWDDWAQCWVRIKLDMAHIEGDVLVVTDWKTGKFRSDNLQDYLEQLELYGLGALLMYGATRPGIRVRPRLIYTDHNVVYPGKDDPVIEYTMADLPKLKKIWAARVKPMLADKTFAPKPNRFCQWCHYRASNKANGGGQCQY